MRDMTLRLGTWLRTVVRSVHDVVVLRRPWLRQEDGQTTAEYALVILAAAAIALVLLAWAQSSGKLPAFFDKVIDDLIDSF
jgi:Flp pilus assembly pilin Flp